MQHLPALDEQAWLIERLKELMGSIGPGNFLDGPLVLPDRRFFPDPWSFSRRGIDRLTRRLMQYAGLGHLDVEVRFFSEIEPLPEGCESAVALFLGIEGLRCHFAIDDSVERSSENVAGVMCHEVAHAFRSHRGLSEAGSSDEEELLTDLTTVYLGFGILAANNRLRVRTSGWASGHSSYHSMSAERTGYLPVQAFTYLLGAQLVAWNLSPESVRKLSGYLETDQSAFLATAMGSFSGGHEELLSGICPNGVPAARERRLSDILLPLPEFVDPDPLATPVAKIPRNRRNQGMPVFKMTTNRALSYFQVAGYGSIPLIIVAVISTPQQMIPLVIGGWIGVVVVAALLGRSRTTSVCTQPDCGVRLVDETVCPGCGGDVVGTVARADDRLDALEEYERDHGVVVQDYGEFEAAPWLLPDTIAQPDPKQPVSTG